MRTCEPISAVAKHLDGLRTDLAQLQGKEIVVLVNRGNRGDGVIHMAGRSLFASAGLEWREIEELEAPASLKADVLLVFSAGAFCQTTHTMVDVTERLSRGVSQVILLPGSFDVRAPAVAKFARGWDERWTVYCREKVSYEALRAVVSPKCQLKLSHDLAFAADLSEWANRPHSGRIGIFRRDKEITFQRLPRDLARIDASHGPHAEATALLDIVARYSEIHTDRTHAAITGAMMGRQVWMYCNRYYKNSAIYQHSMADLPNVHFMDRQPFSLRECARALYWTARRHAFKARARLRAAVG
jgi:hypothetical protein